MRLSTGHALERSLELIQLRQQALNESHERVSSGKRILRASDDPGATARAERALATSARADANQRGLEASRNAMLQAESTLGDASNLLQHARELIVQAGNPINTDAQRQTLASAIRDTRKQLLETANRGDGAGGFLFGGQGVAAPPFVDTVGGVQFRGTSGQILTASGEPLPMTVDGDHTWLRANTGNGVFVTAPAAANSRGAWIDPGRVADPSALSGDDYAVVFTVTTAPPATSYAITQNGAPTAITAAPYVAGRSISIDGMELVVNGVPADGDRFDITPSTPSMSVLDALESTAAQLGAGLRSGAQVAQTVSMGLRDLDQGLNQLIAVRARLGETLGSIDGAEGRIAESKLLATTERSAAEDVDMAQAVSEFQNRQTSYDAALKAYSMVQRLSLFEYLR